MNRDKPAKNVDERDCGCNCGQRLNDVGRVVAAAHQVQRADASDARDGDVHGHQGGAKS